MELFIVRHGQSANNRGDLPRQPDPPLTELGEEQARRAGHALRELGINHLYSSPMRRTLETARLILDSVDVTPHVFVALHEWGGVVEYGDAEEIIHHPGLARDEILEIHDAFNVPEEITERGWWTRRWNTVEESIQISRENAETFLRHIETHHREGDRIALVMHGGSGSTLIETVFDLPAIPGLTRFVHSNTGISNIRFRPEGAQVHWLNRIDHLSDDLVSS